MAFYDYLENRFIFLIEEFKLSILSGRSVADSIKYFSQKFQEFSFLKELSEKMEQGKATVDAMGEVSSMEGSNKIKSFLDALNSGNFTFQKLDELRDSLLKGRKENFEAVSESLMSKIGWLAFFAIIPIGVYFLSTMADIFRSIEMSDLVITNSMKIGATAVCAVLFFLMLFSKRLKYG